MKNDVKDLNDQAFENAIGYESDLRQINHVFYDKNSILFSAYPIKEGGDRNSFSNFIFSNCFPRYRNFNSTTFNK